MGAELTDDDLIDLYFEAEDAAEGSSAVVMQKAGLRAVYEAGRQNSERKPGAAAERQNTAKDSQ